MSECKWTRSVCDGLRGCGAEVFNATGSRYQPRGWPDRWVSHCLWTGWLEFKDFATPLEPLQARTIERIYRQWPGGAWVVRRGRPSGIMVQDWGGRTVATTHDTPETLLCSLFVLQCRQGDWVERRQAQLQAAFDALKTRGQAKTGSDSVLVTIGEVP